MVVPTFKKSIYKVQISTFFRIMSFLRRTHVKLFVLGRNHFFTLYESSKCFIKTRFESCVFMLF
nr:hypothetical protein [Leptospira kirschneri]